MSRYHAVHANPQGPGDARPTALQIVKDEGLLGKLSDKVMLVTGASSGIGVETVAALHATGATIFATARDLVKGRKVVDEILARKWGVGKIHLVEMELGCFGSVRRGVDEILGKTDRMDVVVCNAGVGFSPCFFACCGPFLFTIAACCRVLILYSSCLPILTKRTQIMATPYTKTTDGYESQFATNHLSHFLLFHLLKPTLLSSATPHSPSRIISLSSVGHRSGQIRFQDFNFEEPGSYTPWSSYGQSKTANIYFANEIERRYGSRNLHAMSLHPGGIATGLQDHLGELRKAFEIESVRRTMKSTEQGASTSVFAAVSEEWKGRGGVYLSDCEVMGPVVEMDMMKGDNGFAEWAFDGEKAERLWVESLKMVGVDGED